MAMFQVQWMVLPDARALLTVWGLILRHEGESVLDFGCWFQTVDTS